MFGGGVINLFWVFELLGFGEFVLVGGGFNLGVVFLFLGCLVFVLVFIFFFGIFGLGGIVELGGFGVGIFGLGCGIVLGDIGVGIWFGFDEVVFGGEIFGLGGSGGGIVGVRVELDDEGLGVWVDGWDVVLEDWVLGDEIIGGLGVCGNVGISGRSGGVEVGCNVGLGCWGLGNVDDEVRGGVEVGCFKEGRGGVDVSCDDILGVWGLGNIDNEGRGGVEVGCDGGIRLGWGGVVRVVVLLEICIGCIWFMVDVGVGCIIFCCSWGIMVFLLGVDIVFVVVVFIGCVFVVVFI